MGQGNRIVATLFTDVVASTELLHRVGPSAAEAIRVRHFSVMRGALAVHGGREVKTLGDGFMAVFESASGALDCAAAMQRAAARERRSETAGAIEIRIGVSAGETSCADGDFYGPSVVEARRLCDAAASGEVLVADVVRVVIGDAAHAFSLPRTLALKGIAEPARACALDWGADEDFALRVALVDDSRLLRAGVAQVLQSLGMDVVLEASDATDLTERISATDPHVVVLDVRMPPTHTTEGLDAARRIRAERPDVGVLVLSASVEPDAARRLLEAGSEGVGYLLKERIGDVDELSSAIRTVARGGTAIDPTIIGLLG